MRRVQMRVLWATASAALVVAFTSIPVVAAPVTNPAAEHVTAIKVNVPGLSHVTPDQVTVSVQEWLPAPGFSARQLHAKLAAQGVPGLVDPGADVDAEIHRAIALSVPPGYPPESDYGCMYRSASTFRCPAPIWLRNGFSNPRVYFNDSSSSAWPVGTAITTWNNSPKIAPRWTTGGCPAISGSHCVWVQDGGYGNTGWSGYTYLEWDGYYHFKDNGTASIRFNDYYGSNHQAVACHEVGHALGMGHNTTTGSCMYSQDPQSSSPNGDDYYVMANLLYP